MSANIPEGYELLSGRSRVNAITALATAEERGLDPQSVLTVRDGFLIPLGDSKLPEVETADESVDKKTGPEVTADAEAEVHPTPNAKKDNHDTIDAWASEHDVTYEGIEAADVEKPTKAEKVAHIEAIISARTLENDKILEETGVLSGTETKGE